MDIPYTVTNRPDTGLYNAKIGIWLFLASEVMLFGGLFSGYVFLRMGSPTMWPFQPLNILYGAVNTVVLISSSVFVVMAWASLKMRKYGMYKLWMTLTILCSLIFMGIKTVEYYAKFTHAAVVLKDHSHITGHMVNNKMTYKIDSIKIDFTKSKYAFLKYIKAEEPVTAKSEIGTAGTLDADWLDSIRQSLPDEVNIATVKLDTPTEFVIPRKLFLPHNEESVTVKGGDVLMGKMVGEDALELVPDGVIVSDVEGDRSQAMAIKLLSNADEVRNYYIERIKHIEAGTGHSKSADPRMSHVIHFKDMAHEAGNSEHPTEQMDGHAETEKAEHGGEKLPEHTDGAVAGEHGGHASIKIPFDQVRRYSSHDPSYNNYYAIYFTLTALHGLHVVCGAAVLAYFLFFGRKMYESNPEHLANRVEVGGLFWHFVDLVWIFLFPVLYLM